MIPSVPLLDQGFGISAAADAQAVRLHKTLGDVVPLWLLRATCNSVSQIAMVILQFAWLLFDKVLMGSRTSVQQKLMKLQQRLISAAKC